MNGQLFDNSAAAWLSALGIGLAVLLGLYLARLVLVRRLGRLAARTATRYDDIVVAMLAATHGLVLVVLAAWAGAHALVLTDPAHQLLARAATAAVLVQAALWADRGLTGWLLNYRSATVDPARATSTAALGFIARIVLWSVIALMILDNLGFNITTLVASLGIGGVAVALAVQNILGDLFASLSIVLDKPFVIGDFVVVDDMAGTIEHVGLKTTRIRSLAGEQIVYSNTKLLASRIHNYKRMQARRVVFTIGVVYGTPREALRAIPPLLEQAIRAQDGVRFERAHFNRFGPSSLDFEVVYHVDSADYQVYMDVQQEIFLEIYGALSARGIDFAFPTQTLHLERVPARDRAARQGAAGTD